jgi:2-dehydro-3-deoxygalactonokinase
MIVIDWGTSSFRAYWLAEDGAVRERREAPLGILQLKGPHFAGAFESQVGHWAAQDDGPILMSGMIGSRQGWAEAPYAECPAGPDDVAGRLLPVEWQGRRLWIVPGLVDRTRGVPDVMRGEETQLFGVLDTLGPGGHTVCLPGTHSKWVRVENGRVTGFRTHMTGEVFAVLKQHSILGRLMNASADDEAAFDGGLARSAEPGGLLHHLFGVRTLGLFEELPPASLASYLSGILIGHELAAETGSAGMVHILGAPQLGALYVRALRHSRKTPHILDADAAVAGLYRLARNLPRKNV